MLHSHTFLHQQTQIYISVAIKYLQIIVPPISDQRKHKFSMFTHKYNRLKTNHTLAVAKCVTRRRRRSSFNQTAKMPTLIHLPQKVILPSAIEHIVQKRSTAHNCPAMRRVVVIVRSPRSRSV